MTLDGVMVQGPITATWAAPFWHCSRHPLPSRSAGPQVLGAWYLHSLDTLLWHLPSLPLGSLLQNSACCSFTPGAFSGPSRLEYVFLPRYSLHLSYWSTDHNLFSLLTYRLYAPKWLELCSSCFHQNPTPDSVSIIGAHKGFISEMTNIQIQGVWGTEEWTLFYALWVEHLLSSIIISLAKINK